MRLTGFLLLAAVLHVSAAGRAQTVTYSARDVALPQVLAAIEQQTGYTFIYNDAALEGTRTVTVRLRGVPLKDALDAVLAGQPLGYDIEGKTVALVRKVVLPAAAEAAAPPGEVTGTVVDETGQPLAGATIKLKNGKILGLTDEKGNFKLKNVSATAIIEISYTGFGVTEVSVNRSSALKVVLKQANNKLDDVQVIAYGTTTERLNTGDVTTVTAKEIEEQPVSNPLAALEGRVPGMFIAQNTGAPGGSFTVQIRGQNSLTNGNDPFYVIDGVPYPSETLGSINSTLDNGSPLNFINPSDIESIEILKDADATSIYGSRAANGAVLITTKKGKAGTSKVDLNVYSGVAKVTRMMDLMNTQQYLEMRNEAFNNDGATPGPSDYDVNGTWDSTRYTNWQKVLIGNAAHYLDAQGSASGGSTTTQYLIGGGLHRESTVFPVGSGDGPDQKASVHFNINTTSPNNKFKAMLSGNYIADQNNVAPLDQTQNTVGLAPDAPPIYNADGTLNWAPLVTGQAGTWTNPLSQLALIYTGRTYNLVSNAVLSYSIIPGLNIKTNLGYNNIQTNEIFEAPTTAFDPGAGISSGNSSFNTANIRSWIVEPQANYEVRIGQGIFEALVGSTFEKNVSEAQSLNASGFSSNEFLGDIQAATSLSVQSVTNATYKYDAIFSRLTYKWREKYIFNLTGRRDGSSRFGPSSQFANFGAMGAAWIFSKEKLIENMLPFVSFGKLRASYGTSGNDQIGDYRYLDLYTNTQYTYQGNQGLYPTNLFNPNLAWELNKKLEGGIELGFLKDRFTVKASYYRNKSGNQLVTTPLSGVTGFSSIAANLPAVVQNKGMEFSFNTINIKSRNFTWLSSFNLTIPYNKLLSFPNLSTSPYVNDFIVGQPITILKVYHCAGINDSTGIYQFTDSKGEKTYNPSYPSDLTSIVNLAPKFYGGFQNSFQYKSFSLDFLFQFVKQIAPNFTSYYSGMPGTLGNQPTAVLNHWQMPGDVRKFQQFSENYGGNVYSALSTAQLSDFVYGDASFIRLKNLAFSWQLPQMWKQKIHLQNCRIYVQGQNLFTITKYYGFDPETHNLGLPPLRVLTTGIQITL